MLYFTDTKASQLEAIIQMEQENAYFICPYTRPVHLQLMRSEGDRHLSVLRKSDNEMVGFFILQGINSSDKCLQFRRIVIADKGKGHGKKCLQWAKKYCFEKLKFHRMWLDVFTDNERAIHLYEAEGLQKEGMLRESIRRDSKFRSLFIFSMLESEYFQ